MTSSTPRPGTAVHGGTALGDRDQHPRHRFGDVLRAIRVYAVTAAEVVLLGDGDARRT